MHTKWHIGAKLIKRPLPAIALLYVPGERKPPANGTELGKHVFKFEQLPATGSLPGNKSQKFIHKNLALALAFRTNNNHVCSAI